MQSIYIVSEKYFGFKKYFSFQNIRRFLDETVTIVLKTTRVLIKQDFFFSLRNSILHLFFFNP